MNEGLILQELKEIKEQLQSINDALKPKKHFCNRQELESYSSTEICDRCNMKEPTKRCTISIG